MTSIMHPGTYARMNAIQARQSLVNAATVLHNGGPLEPGKPSIGVPAEQAALMHAEKGMRHLRTALGVEGQLSRGAVTALSAARDQAAVGVRHLGSPTSALVDRTHVGQQFDAATMWLDLAINLIDLEMRAPRPGATTPSPRPGTPPMPPVTILPLPRADDATILPFPGDRDLPTFEVQLPHPDSPVQ